MDKLVDINYLGVKKKKFPLKKVGLQREYILKGEISTHFEKIHVISI